MRPAFGPRRSVVVAIWSALFIPVSAVPAAAQSPPSALCHQTDGAFTACADGSSEWSDVPFAAFPETNSFLYADQADLDPNAFSVNPLTGEVSPLDTLVLLYDECARTTRPGPDEYVLVNFDTVETETGSEELIRYSVHVFGDATLLFFQNGQLQTDAAGRFRVTEIDGQRGSLGFGTSPRCAFDHVIAEYQIILETAGGFSYSPDPLFWTSDPPKKPELPPCPDSGTSLPVTLQPVTAPVRTGLKPYQITYGQLPLQFTVQPGSGCRVVSNRGELPVLLDLFRGAPPPPFQVATSVATAALDFLPQFDAGSIPRCDFAAVNNNCLLNAPPSGSGPVVRWSTDGFTEVAFGQEITNTGPLTFYANLENFSGSFDSFGNVLQQAEQFIHETLINHLSGIDRLGLIQDPPADLLLIDAMGRRTGVLLDGSQVEEIPRSRFFRFDESTAIVLIEPDDGQYDIVVLGTPGEEFSLSASVAELRGNLQVPRVTEFQADGVSQPGGVSFPWEIRPASAAGPLRAGFDQNALPANDDGSTGRVPLGFAANFFGTGFDSVFVNNNGNLTLDERLGTFTPFPLTSTGRRIIAPFFADVDTRVGNVVVYGQGFVGDRPAFGVTWPGVGCFPTNTSVRNFFQVVLIDRSDVGPGDFDIEFNYQSIQWETGQASGGDVACQGGASARAGYSNGTGLPGTFFELPGSGTPGSFLDNNAATGLANNSLNSDERGRYVFSVRSGVPVAGQDRDGDGVPDELDSCPLTSSADQADADLNGVGDVCQSPAGGHATAIFLQALLDGRTAGEPGGTAFADEPTLLERLVRIVDFRVSSGLADDPAVLAENLVESLVRAGLVPEDQAAALIQAVLDALVAAVDIDIKPGSFPNPINPSSRGVIPVAIATTDEFDAADVDPLSLDFGPGAAGETHGQGHLEDVDGDGDLDLMLHFDTSASGILCGQTTASLTGFTFTGRRISGSDSILTVDCSGPARSTGGANGH